MHDPHSIVAHDSASLSRQTGLADRRHFMKSALALALAMHGLPAHAETRGRVLFGFTLTPLLEATMEAVLQQVQPRDRPDLGARPVFLPGNSGLVAMEAVIQAPADGAKAFLSSSASMTLPPLIRKETISPVEVKSMAAYLLWTQANPVLATYGVPGRGTASRFIGTEIARISKTPLKSVAYKGLPPLIEDVARGSMPAAITVRISADDVARHPSLRVLAVSSREAGSISMMFRPCSNSDCPSRRPSAARASSCRRARRPRRSRNWATPSVPPCRNPRSARP